MYKRAGLTIILLASCVICLTQVVPETPNPAQAAREICSEPVMTLAQAGLPS